MKTHLDFEQPLVDLQAKLDALTKTSLPSGIEVDFQHEVDQIRDKIKETRKSIYSCLTPWLHALECAEPNAAPSQSSRQPSLEGARANQP